MKFTIYKETCLALPTTMKYDHIQYAQMQKTRGKDFHAVYFHTA